MHQELERDHQLISCRLLNNRWRFAAFCHHQPGQNSNQQPQAKTIPTPDTSHLLPYVLMSKQGSPQLQKNSLIVGFKEGFLLFWTRAQNLTFMLAAQHQPNIKFFPPPSPTLIKLLFSQIKCKHYHLSKLRKITGQCCQWDLKSTWNSFTFSRKYLFLLGIFSASQLLELKYGRFLDDQPQKVFSICFPPAFRRDTASSLLYTCFNSSHFLGVGDYAKKHTHSPQLLTTFSGPPQVLLANPILPRPCWAGLLTQLC